MYNNIKICLEIFLNNPSDSESLVEGWLIAVHFPLMGVRVSAIN